jgi:hypothetical protein
MGPTPRALVRSLLKADLPKRLTDATSIQAAEFFQNVDFVAVNQKRIRPPQTPLILSIGDTSRFDEYRPRECLADEFDSSKLSFAGF